MIVNNEAKRSLIALYKGLKSHILPLKSHPQPTRNSCDRSGGQEKRPNSSNDGIHMHSLSYLQMSGRLKGYYQPHIMALVFSNRMSFDKSQWNKILPKSPIYTRDLHCRACWGWGKEWPMMQHLL